MYLKKICLELAFLWCRIKSSFKLGNFCIIIFLISVASPVFLPVEFCGWRSLVGCCPWGRTELDTTEATYMHACTGGGNGNHSGVLAWRIPGTEEPGGLPSMGSQRVRHNWSDLATAAAAASSWVNIFSIYYDLCLHFLSPSFVITSSLLYFHGYFYLFECFLSVSKYILLFRSEQYFVF